MKTRNFAFSILLLLFSAMSGYGQAPVDQGLYYIEARHSGKVLTGQDNNGTDKADPNIVIQRRNRGATTQLWRMISKENGKWAIQNTRTGNFLSVANCNKDDGALWITWKDLSNDCFRFRLTETTEGYFVIVALHTGKALDVPGESTDDDVAVVQYTAHAGQNQQWKFIPANQVSSGTQSSWDRTDDKFSDWWSETGNWVACKISEIGNGAKLDRELKPGEAYLSVFNQSGYVATVNVEITFNGEKKSFEQDISLGQTAQCFIPPGTTDTRMWVTSKCWPNREVQSAHFGPLNDGNKYAIKIYGACLSEKWNRVDP